MTQQLAQSLKQLQERAAQKPEGTAAADDLGSAEEALTNL